MNAKSKQTNSKSAARQTSTGGNSLAGAVMGGVLGNAFKGPTGAFVGTLGGAVAGSLPIVDAIRAIYGTARDINGFIDEQIDAMKSSSKEAIQVCGKVLEGVKFGFGIGYLTSTVVIATGHFLLGNISLATAVTVNSATLTNPIAMTCGAIGAIYFGWTALDERERQEILERIVTEFRIGVELVKSIINFVLEKMKIWTSSETIEDLKNFVKESAEKFGKSLSEITRKLKDKIFDTIGYVREKAEDVGDFVKENVIDPVRDKIEKKES